MKKIQISQRLKSVYATLNMIEVKGEANVSYLFGSLATLKEAIQLLETVLDYELEKEDESKNIEQ